MADVPDRVPANRREAGWYHGNFSPVPEGMGEFYFEQIRSALKLLKEA